MEPNTCKVIAGDDFPLGVSFHTESGEAYELADGDTAVLILHTENGDTPIEAAEKDGNTVKFWLSGERTQALLQGGRHAYVSFCIRVYFADGTRCTPIHRAELMIEGC